MLRMSIILMILLSSSILFIQAKPQNKVATFAGGCFWCMEPPFEKIKGVKSVYSGYTGGDEKNPTYEQVSRHETGHLEAIQITYDPILVKYDDLLNVFWQNVNPTDKGGQFVDRGHQYTTAIYYHDSEQKKRAEKSKKQLDNSKKFKDKIVTPILKAKEFYKAEDYHQDFYKKSTDRYKSYRRNSGRDLFMKRIWGNELKKEKSYKIPSQFELKKILTSIQFNVTQKNGTEKSFQNEYWDNKKKGIYVDIVSGEVLFSSRDKFKSGTGWPSFTKPAAPKNVISKKDKSLLISGTEVRSKHADSHLGHVFSDGPGPTGLRYCVNSASLRFIPFEKMKSEGYEEFMKEFDD